MRGKSLFAVGLAFLGATAAAAQNEGQSSPSVAELETELQAREQETARLRAAILAKKKEAAEAAVRAGEEARQYLASLQQGQAVTPAPAAAAPNEPPAPGEVVETTQTTTTKPDGTTEQTTETKRYSQEQLRDSDENTQRFGGIEFGIGVAFGYDLGESDRVKSAVLVSDGNGGQIVRVTDRENVSARLILESHYLLTPYGGRLNSIMDWFGVANEWNEDPKKRQRNWGYGPFIAIQPGEDDIISAIGGGLMFGFRRPDEETASFNIGFGVLYDLNVRLLGEGIVANRPLPPGETEIRYLEEEQSGFLIMTSYSF